MAPQDFKNLATQFVLSDNDDEQTRCALAAANALQAASNVRMAIADWAASINTWMPARSHSSDAMVDEGQDGEAESDVIARAKALTFLSKTLEFTTPDLLKPQQIELLISFFGILFSADHKAGISAATNALQHLSNMKSFKPQMGGAILGYIVQLKDDFPLQTPVTRLEVYRLVARLVGDPAIVQHIHDNHEDPNRPIKDLLQLCSHERDPKNLIQWFGILQTYIKGPLATSEIAHEIFTAYSAYFPISMRSSTASSGITVNDLKTALRNCFRASHLVAAPVYEFLRKKLDQGEGSVSVTVKVDVLDTISASVQGFPDPLNNVTPHAAKIWDSIKYEIRHGEVDDIIAAALQTIRTLTNAIDEYRSSHQLLELSGFEEFIDGVQKWCSMDLASSTHLRSAVLILGCVSGATPRAFSIMTDRIIAEVDRNFLQNGREVEQGVAFLNIILRNRQELLESYGSIHPGVTLLQRHDPLVYSLLNKYLKVWINTRTAPQGPEAPGIYKETMRGFAEMVRQTKQAPGLDPTPLFDADDRQRIVDLLIEEMTPEFHVLDSTGLNEEVAAEAVVALKAISKLDCFGFSRVIKKAFVSIFDLEGTSPSDGLWDASGPLIKGLQSWDSVQDPVHTSLQTMLKRIAYIGCSVLATENDPLANMIELLQSLTSIIVYCIDNNACPGLCEDLLIGLYSALLNIFNTITVEAPEEITVAEQTAFWESSIEKHPFSDDTTTTPKDITFQGFGPGSADEQSGHRYLSLEAQAMGLFVLKFLCPRAQAIIGGQHGVANELSQDRCLGMLSRIVAFVVSRTGEAGQSASQLYQKAFAFSGVDNSLFNDKAGGRLDVITKGYLQGLRPNVLVRMIDVGFQPLSLLEDLDHSDHINTVARRERDLISMLVANKFSGDSGLVDTQRQSWAATVKAVEEKLEKNSSRNLTYHYFSRLLHITAGAIARLDAGAKQLAPLLIEAAINHYHDEEHLARSLDRLASVGDVLNDNAHAVARKLHKQWLYHHVVSPNLSRAFPLSAKSQESRRATIAVLAILRHMPVAAYTNDIAAIVRVAIAAMGDATAAALPEPYEVALALHVLNEVADADAAALKGHIRKVVESAAEIMQIRGNWPSSSYPSRTDPQLGKGTYCRKLATAMICKLPECYQQELGLLVPYKPLAFRVLRIASGDPARELRELANEGRDDWQNVS